MPHGDLQSSALRKPQAPLGRDQLTHINHPTYPDQAIPVEGLKIGQFQGDTLNIGSTHPYEGATTCLTITSSPPGISHIHAPFEGRIEAGHVDVGTRGCLWSDEQALNTPVPEECAGSHAVVSFPIGAVSQPTCDLSTTSECTPTGLVGSGDDVMGGRDGGGVGRSPTDCITTTPANLDTCKAAGYHSIDSMATEYYTASFPPNSYLAATQSRSRNQNLPRLLDSIYASSSACNHEGKCDWASTESEKFREKLLALATHILIDEVVQMERAQDQAAGIAPAAAFAEDNGQVSPDEFAT